MSDQTHPRIAIRFGASSKGSKNPPSRPAQSSTLGKRHRPQFDNDADSDGDEPEDTRHETITHFGANGAEFVDEKPLRRDERKSDGQKPGSRRAASPADGSPAIPSGSKKNGEPMEEEPLKYGLTVAKKIKTTESNQDALANEEDGPHEPKTADEEAMDALLGKDIGRHHLLHRTEEDAYRDATANAPEVDDLATYEAIPVEGFGASLLKGQGWDGKMRGPKSKEITKRPNGMGLGAKKLTAEENLGGWDSKGKSEKRPRLDEYRREKDKERNRREDRYRDSYKNERDRDYDRDRHRDSNRERDRDRHRDRDRDRDRDSYKHHNRDSRR